MTQIDNITNDATQAIQVILVDGSTLTINLVYRPAIERWVVDISHSELTVNALNLCIHGNLLREWRKVISFGLACTAVDGVDPFNIDDFSNGRCALYALDEDDVQAVEANLYGAAQ